MDFHITDSNPNAHSIVNGSMNVRDEDILYAEVGCQSGRVINTRIELINQRQSRLRLAVLTSHHKRYNLPLATSITTQTKSKSIVVGFVARQHISILFTICFLITTVTGLIGEHVCQQEERYTINVTKYFPRNVTIRSFQWCYQIPPRCSIFTHQVINDSRIEEEERTRLVTACCDGFLLDSTGEKCEPSCNTNCINGKCNEENKCYCEPGYRGDYCKKGCDSSRWGRYCRYHCDCQRGTCDPGTGVCNCPPGWTGLKCEKQCYVGYFGEHCHSTCNCSIDQICDREDGHCTNKVKVAVLKKYHTFDILEYTTQKTQQFAKKVDMYLLTTEPSNASLLNNQKTTEFETKQSVKYLKLNTNKFESTTSNGSSNETLLTTTVLTSTTRDLNEESTNASSKNVDKGKRVKMATGDVDLTDRYVETNIKSMDRKVMKSEIPFKGKVQAEVVVNDSSNKHDFEVGNVKTVETATASLETKHNDDVQTKKIYNFATISFIGIVFVAVFGFLIGGHLLKRHEKDVTHVNKNIPKSIFHTPLPDPPQSPFFESPICVHYHKRIGDNDVVLHPNTGSTLDRKSETLTGNKKAVELSDVFYDQLPSTGGSYKAAAIILEPPPLQSPDEYVQKPNRSNAQSSINSPSASLENVYDEIPCWTRSTEHDALYINTRIENKTQF